jgi:membrane-associated phospholipid phosphatase
MYIYKMSLYTPKSHYKKADLFDINKVGPIRDIDFKLSKAIYDLFNQKGVEQLPVWLGLVPYEFYILPGMYLAIFQTLWLGTPNPVQFHLLPHWFAYSIFQLLKGSIKTYRPGCWIKTMGKFIDESHCLHGHEFQSFPSGHTGIATSLATALFCEMMFSEDPHFFEMNIKNDKIRNGIAFIGLFVAFMTGIHRVSKGYHSLFDSMTGMLIGACIGFMSWSAMEYYKRRYNKLCEKNSNDEACDNHEYSKKDAELDYWLKDWGLFKSKVMDDPSFGTYTGIARLVLTIPVLYLTIKFFVKDFWKLASIKH